MFLEFLGLPSGTDGPYSLRTFCRVPAGVANLLTKFGQAISKFPILPKKILRVGKKKTPKPKNRDNSEFWIQKMDPRADPKK